MIAENPPQTPITDPPDLIILHWASGTRFGLEQRDMLAVVLHVSEELDISMTSATDLVSAVVGAMMSLPQTEPALTRTEW